MSYGESYNESASKCTVSNSRDSKGSVSKGSVSKGSVSKVSVSKGRVVTQQMIASLHLY